MKSIKTKKDITFSNSLITSRYQLSREEQSIIFLIASQINKNDEDFKTYKVSVSDLDRVTGVEHNRKRIKELSLSIMSKPLILPNKTIVNWFSRIKPVEKESALEVRFDKDLKPYLLELEEYFTKGELNTLLDFKFKYTCRLYMLLKSDFGKQSNYKDIVYKVYEIKDLAKMFCMPSSYLDRYSIFKNDFLKKSLDEINDLSDIYITFDDENEQRKCGRKIMSIEFCIKMADKKNISTEKMVNEILNIKTKSDCIPPGASKYVIETLLADEMKLSIEDIDNIFNNYSLYKVESVCYKLFNSWDSKKLNSRIAFFRGELKKLKSCNKKFPPGDLFDVI